MSVHTNVPQATIEYLHYLERCLKDLKLGHKASTAAARISVPTEDPSLEGEKKGIKHIRELTTLPTLKPPSGSSIRPTFSKSEIAV